MVKKVRFKIKGMHCVSCAMNIDGELEDSGKVKEVNTNFARSETEVTYEEGKITLPEIISLIEKAGYKAELKED